MGVFLRIWSADVVPYSFKSNAQLSIESSKWQCIWIFVRVMLEKSVRWVQVNTAYIPINTAKPLGVGIWSAKGSYGKEAVRDSVASTLQNPVFGTRMVQCQYVFFIGFVHGFSVVVFSSDAQLNVWRCSFFFRCRQHVWSAMLPVMSMLSFGDMGQHL